jgi:hypothetical protein
MKNHETAAIERDFPDWLVWLSRHGVCWAATLRVPAPGRDATVIRDSADELRLALADQSRRMNSMPVQASSEAHA